MIGVELAGIETIQSNGLIADQTRGTIGGGGIKAMSIQVGLGTNDEETAGPVQNV